MKLKANVVKLVGLAGVLSLGTIVSIPTATHADPSAGTMTQPTKPVASPAPMASPSAATTQDTIVGIASTNSSFKTLTAALQAAGLVETLNGSGPFTVFAPTDAAFAKLPKGTVENLLKPENKAKLIQVLTYHVVPGQVLSTSLRPGPVKTVEGNSVSVMVGTRGVTVNQSKVTGADIKASNGVIHVIDTVLLPPTK
ncbi:MAG: fasciclin domain-containing protein [Leptolyngbyaceae cyanobacterium CSU_1_3]|nr:fasciclin domain-containing protein [Leptolyngbyaceae cyanobacterium CSU_1_3]